MWHTKNLRCASCMGSCAVCNTACCMYEAGCRAKKDPRNCAFKAAQAERIVSNIEALGSHVRDNTTFIMCTLGGGCGRYVCPECCGICLNVACQDVQCKVNTMGSLSYLLSFDMILTWSYRNVKPILGVLATGIMNASHFYDR